MIFHAVQCCTQLANAPGAARLVLLIITTILANFKAHLWIEATSEIEADSQIEASKHIEAYSHILFCFVISKFILNSTKHNPTTEFIKMLHAQGGTNSAIEAASCSNSLDKI